MKRFIMSVIFILLTGLGTVCGQTVTHATETSLRAALKTGYDSEVKPYTPTNIEVDYYIRSVQALDIASQSLTHTALLNIVWHDPRLVWNATDYGNLTALDIKWAWRPLFIIANGLDSLDMYGGDDDEMRLMVHSNGSVFWQQAIHPTTVCDVNVKQFPYDVQSCDVLLSFFGYTYDTDITFNISTEASLAVYLENEEWIMDRSTVAVALTPACCPQSIIGSVLTTFTFQRLHAFYLNTFLIPTYLMSICLIWPFYLPTESGERLGFALTVLLSYTVILSAASGFLPTTSRQVPLLAGYLLGVLFLCSLAVCNVAINVKIYFLETDPNKTLKKIYRKVNPIVFFECKRKKTSTKVKVFADGDKEKPPIPVEEEPTETEVTWAKISILLDRICFIVYTITVLALNLSLIAYLG